MNLIGPAVLLKICVLFRLTFLKRTFLFAPQHAQQNLTQNLCIYFDFTMAAVLNIGTTYLGGGGQSSTPQALPNIKNV
jgi:hypothetical protein